MTYPKLTAWGDILGANPLRNGPRTGEIEIIVNFSDDIDTQVLDEIAGAHDQIETIAADDDFTPDHRSLIVVKTTIKMGSRNDGTKKLFHSVIDHVEKQLIRASYRQSGNSSQAKSRRGDKYNNNPRRTTVATRRN